MRNPTLTSPGMVFVAAVCCRPASAQCASQWLPGVGVPGVGWAAYASRWWDPDGTGPLASRLVVGGSFVLAGSVIANNIAAYDPVTGQWASLGAGVDMQVQCLAMTPNGELLAGGSATVANIASARVMRWDGANWNSVATLPLPGPAGASWIDAMAIMPNGDLIAAGLAPGGPTHAVVRWSGVTWSPLGAFPGVPAQFPPLTWPDSVAALAVLPNGDLVVGGVFASISGVAAANIARWNGSTWSPLGSGVAGSVGELSVLANGDLIAAGSFTSAGGVAAQNIARWDGGQWSPLGSGVADRVDCTGTLANGDLLVGTRDATSNLGHLHRWNGAAWTPYSAAPAAGFFSSLQPSPSGDVFVFGGFSSIAGTVALGAARWDGSSWQALASGTDGPVTAIHVEPGGDVIVGGGFRSIGGTPANGVARWNGTTWTALGGPPLPSSPIHVTSVATLSNGDVIVAGQFTSVAGTPANNLARWDGTAWHALGSGTEQIVQTLVVRPGGELIAGGMFHTAGGITANGVARWNGTLWAALPAVQGGGTDAVSAALAPNGDLYVAGGFAPPGGPWVHGVARWNGASWQPLGAGPGWWSMSSVLVTPNGDVIAAGLSSGSGSTIARWNGSAWIPLPAGPLQRVDVMASLPNGDLVAADNHYSPRIARWDGLGWTPLGAGCDGGVLALAALPGGELLVGGGFHLAGGAPSAFFARWNTNCPPTTTAYGVGCSGSGGRNALATTTQPWNGTTFRARATGMPAEGVAIAAYGFAVLGIPLASLHPAGLAGCDLLVDDDVVQLVAVDAGVADTAVLVATSPSLVGAQFHHQVIAVDLDPLRPAITSTNALTLLVGTY